MSALSPRGSDRRRWFQLHDGQLRWSEGPDASPHGALQLVAGLTLVDEASSGKVTIATGDRSLTIYECQDADPLSSAKGISQWLTLLRHVLTPGGETDNLMAFQAAAVTPGGAIDEQVAAQASVESSNAAARLSDAQSLAISEDACWLQPPSSDPFWVDFRFNLFRVAKIDTVEGSAWVMFKIIFYWTDLRLAGWEQDDLPGKLWGPVLTLENGLSDFTMDQEQFVVSNRNTGRMKRLLKYCGFVDNPMDLARFPFDLDELDLQFNSNSTFWSFDRERFSSLTKGRTYRLRQIREPGEGEWLVRYWDGKVQEWDLLGVSTLINERPPNAFGAETTYVTLSFHVARKSSFYFWKALMPLYLLTALNLFSALSFETDNLSDRIATTATFFLAAFAMLYVVGSSLPKTDFLTRIDLIILITTFSLAVIGLGSCLIAWVHTIYGADVAWFCNVALGVFALAVNMIGNIAALLPLQKQQHAAIAASKATETIYDAEPGAVRSTFSYIPLNDIPKADAMSSSDGKIPWLFRRAALPKPHQATCKEMI